MVKNKLLVGTSEVDITPPVGTPLAGSLKPRISIGIEDPLYVKSIVLESNGERLAYVVFDLVKLSREFGDAFVSMASEKTGIPASHIIWTTSHTHTGPYTTPTSTKNDNVNMDWLTSLCGKAVESVVVADSSKKPARFSRQRSFHYGLGHNRRVSFKGGKVINTWNLQQAPEEEQSLGSSGFTDPEIGILAFDDEEGNLMSVMFHFTLHTNTNFGPRFSGDYPAVVASRINERFGKQVVTLFLPGTFADINSNDLKHRAVGDKLAEKIIPALEKRNPKDSPLKLSAIKKEVVVPRRDFGSAQEKRISDSGWSEESQQYFFNELEQIRKEGKKEDVTVLQAWRIGDIGFTSLPGETFVESGLKIKKESPFGWTYPVELGADTLGYLVTKKAWLEGGYEPLVTRGNRASAEGVEMMVDKVIEMLNELSKEK
jgi:hypothetical protein